MTPVVRLVPMADGAYERWRAHVVREYATEKVSAGRWAPEDAVERSEDEVRRLLPDGVATAGHHLWTIEDGTGAQLGALWVGPDPVVAGSLYIWDIEVDPGVRGRGIGRAALDRLEAWAREAGYGRIGLHVLGANDVARRLYARAGYVETDVMMEKRL